ncbi:MAG: hypothetical protein SGBAC_013012 [Bacillariaceae sp.]
MVKQETDLEDSSGGHVATRIREKHVNINLLNPPFRSDVERRVVAQESESDDGTKSGSHCTKHTVTSSKKRENRTANLDSIKNEKKDEETFKGWLSARILDGLNTAAGATLSTTGQLIAPPLHVTKTVILPSLLSLFVDALDTVAPQRLKDWFRIWSSSIDHLVSVIRSTNGGKHFASSFLQVMQDIALVSSAPETRNILIDTMAFGVKIFDALNTEEVRLLIDHVALLACRMVDVAASGRTKQLFHSIKGLVQNGIEMGSDPAATLAFAEVTAHLCYALEDIHLSSEPENRHNRNDQNRETYLSHVDVSDLPNQPSVEQVILSCLGRLDSSTKPPVADGAELPQQGETRHASNLKDRSETVDVNYLRNKVYPGTSASALSPGHSGNENDASIEKVEEEQPNDIEDFEDEVKQRRKGESTFFRDDAMQRTATEPPLQRFYDTLDTILDKNRSKYNETAFTSLYSTKGRRVDEGKHAPILRAKSQKLKKRLESTAQEMYLSAKTQSSSKHPRKMSVVGSVFVLSLAVLCLTFSIYGVYAFVGSGFLQKHPQVVPEQLQIHQSEIVFRIVREVRHFNADEKEAIQSTFSTDQDLDVLADCISSRLEIESAN